MIVQINNRFEIHIDSIGNHTLIENKPTLKNEKEHCTQITHGYFRDVPSAVNKVIHLSLVSAHERIDLNKYLSEQKRLSEKVISDLKVVIQKQLTNSKEKAK